MVEFDVRSHRKTSPSPSPMQAEVLGSRVSPHATLGVRDLLDLHVVTVKDAAPAPAHVLIMMSLAAFVVLSVSARAGVSVTVTVTVTVLLSVSSLMYEAETAAPAVAVCVAVAAPAPALHLVSLPAHAFLAPWTSRLSP